MRFIISIAVTAFVFLGLACNSLERHLSSAAPANPAKAAPPPPPPPQSDGARRVTTTELKNLMDKGQAFVVDVRSEASYKAGHIKGAVLIPYKDVGARVKEFPRDKTIVTYCA